MGLESGKGGPGKVVRSQRHKEHARIRLARVTRSPAMSQPRRRGIYLVPLNRRRWAQQISPLHGTNPLVQREGDNS